MASRPILVVEDSDEDFAILQGALATAGAANPLLRSVTGHDALELLDRAHRPSPALEHLPVLILLDLNLPGIDGRELLQILRRNERLQAIPALIFSTSANPADVDFCYRAGANAYLVKPMGIEQYEGIVQSLVDFWLVAATLPEGPILGGA